ncbi:putative aminophospholipid-translocase [Batrachochytrium dendrobatidis]|nr:putative aminophospholipid-translocase [Batrachochytrium dendrobatidis]KAK5667561.1 putative aminophospholipid-translocase [Batrachochytrium dendrobatidis]
MPFQSSAARRMPVSRNPYSAIRRQDSTSSMADDHVEASSDNGVLWRGSVADPGGPSQSIWNHSNNAGRNSNSYNSRPKDEDAIPLHSMSGRLDGASRKYNLSDIDSEEAGMMDPNNILPLHTVSLPILHRVSNCLLQFFKRNPKTGKSRTIELGFQGKGFEPNIVRNQKYNFLTFVPVVLFEQFKLFFNMYFLLVALSQLVKSLQIGYLFTYFGPLSFVLVITIGKEALDDYRRLQRDKVANSQTYTRLSVAGPAEVPSSELCVGDLVVIHKNQRVPADCILLRTPEPSGACFIRTDQLDGETDWKLRVAVSHSQKLPNDMAIFQTNASVYAEKPHMDIHSFIGNITWVQDRDTQIDPLTVDNTLWMNTVLASSAALCLIVYTGRDTRAVMNTSFPSTKIGLLDLDINRLSKILALVTLQLSLTMVMMDGFRGLWFIYIFRFLILFSSIIPISLRVNLDMGKTVFSYLIMSDQKIPSTIVRTSTIPEELGRIDYLLTDKTGTLTKNDMELRKLHMGTISYGSESMEEVAGYIRSAFEQAQAQDTSFGTKRTKGINTRLKDITVALALCHNVTPVIDGEGELSYQASSPDEVAIVKWTESIGLTLYFRDMSIIRLRTMHGTLLEYDILDVFSFTSDTKRMGIILREKATGEITFYQKGADAVMTRIVAYNDWLDEECGNMAREGLRTLVIGRKRISEDYYNEFQQKYQEAKICLQNRKNVMQGVVSQYLEKDLELLGLTGVEDKLQDDVKLTLELLRNAGLRIWMLTGDKIETATCIAISSKLVSRNQFIHTIAKVTDPTTIQEELETIRSKTDCALVIDGESLQTCLDFCPEIFMELALCLSVVVCCRCSPTQKADVARLIKESTKSRTCAIGDGGNDVSMIQAAHVGIGIVGKEGMQASLAADFSVTQFSHIARLLLWHGRNSYKRSAKLSQFVIHRGLIISIMQAVFSSLFYFAPIALYQGMLLVGYATFYTMAPVFSLVLDKDISEDTALMYPELYKELVKGRALSYKTFFIWLLISVYQGGAIMMLAIWLFENEFVRVVSISFTALVFNELLMVALEITTWHPYMIYSQLGTAAIYIGSMWLLPAYFDVHFIATTTFVWKVALITAVSSLPLYVYKAVQWRINPPNYTKLEG